MTIQLHSNYGIILTDKWDEAEFEKDIETKLMVDFDESNTEKPFFVEIVDIDNENAQSVIGSICIALDIEQARALILSLQKMVYLKEDKANG